MHHIRPRRVVGRAGKAARICPVSAPFSLCFSLYAHTRFACRFVHSPSAKVIRCTRGCAYVYVGGCFLVVQQEDVVFLAAIARSTAAAAIAVTLPAHAAAARSVRATWSATATFVAARPTRGHFHPDARPTAAGSVEGAHCILRVPFVLEFHEREAGRITCHPDVAQRSVFAKGTLDFMLRRRRS